MPALLPPPIPLFSCSITRTAGKRSRIAATVPSVEPLSTTTTSRPATDSRHFSIQGRALYVTTTTETSATGGRDGRAPVEDALPEDDCDTRQREQHGHDEEQEAAGERRIGVDAEVAEEADEERLAHADPVDGERDQHHEEEERPEDDVREQRQVDADGTPRGVDPDDPGQLEEHRHGRDDDEGPGMVAVAVDAVVDGPCGRLEAQPSGEGKEEREPAPDATREEDDAGPDRQHDEDRLGPEVGADRVAADREQDAHAGEQERDGAAERPLDEHRAGDRRDLPGMAP